MGEGVLLYVADVACSAVDEVGTATRMKLIHNMILGSVVASLGEGMALAEKVGIDQEDLAEVLSLGSLSCPTINHKSQGWYLCNRLHIVLV